MEKEKYLDWTGLQTYHNRLKEDLKDLKFDPQRMFADKADLIDRANWADQNGRVFGAKDGLIVSVGSQLWQLVDPTTFKGVLTTIGGNPESLSAEELGWKVLNDVEFEVTNRVLSLKK